jgi:hypothetical protein
VQAWHQEKARQDAFVAQHGRPIDEYLGDAVQWVLPALLLALAVWLLLQAV